jgi:hypothetical protein
MIPNFKWAVDILKLPLPTVIGVAVSAGALLALHAYGLLNFGSYDAFTTPVLVCVTVISAVIAAIGLINAVLIEPMNSNRGQSKLELRRAIKRKEEEEAREKARSSVVARLDHLSKEEISYLAQCLQNGSPTFYAYVASPPVSILRGKGLVWTPGGTHHEDRYPFSIHDFVWEEMLARKDEILEKHAKNEHAELGRVDELYQAKASGETDDRSEVSFRLFAS